MVLKRSEITRPMLPKETVDVPELGGEVVVKALTLEERLELSTANGRQFGRITQMLSLTVVDHDGEPIFTTEEWNIFGAKKSHEDAVFRLFDVAQRLGGLGGEPEKNEAAPS